MTNEAQIKEVGEFKFAWKASDAADNSIIAYGWANYGGGTKEMVKRFKITYRKSQYRAFCRIGKSFVYIGHFFSLGTAQNALQHEWSTYLKPTTNTP